MPQQKVRRKMLEKIFITKNFSQFKTSHTSKIDVFRTTDNKNIRNMFSKYELFLLDQAYSSSNLSQILILRFPIFRASLPPSPSLPNFTLAYWSPSSSQSSTCFPPNSLFCPTLFDHTPRQILVIPNHAPSQANQIYDQAIYRW